MILPVGFISALFGMVAAARFPGLQPALALPRSILDLHPALAGVTLAAGVVVLALWQLVPAVRIVPHPIYAEWIVCLAAFLLVPLLDPRRIDAPGMAA